MFPRPSRDARTVRQSPFRTFDNAAAGVARVATEATGGYERQPLLLLWGHGVEAAIVNPRNVRELAKAMGWLETTDRIDAGVIAWFAKVKAIAATKPVTETQRRVAALVTRLPG